MTIGRIPLVDQVYLVLILSAGVWGTTVLVLPNDAFLARNITWLMGRGLGIASFALLTAIVVLGILMSHPLNRTTWKKTKDLLVWHRYLSTFLFTFLALHVAVLVLDRYAHVGVLGAFVPGKSTYRPFPVALGTLSFYVLIVTAISARLAQNLPPLLWLHVHRFALVAYVLAWLHGVLAGSDLSALAWLFAASGTAVLAAAVWRYWAEAPRPSRARGAHPTERGSAP